MQINTFITQKAEWLYLFLELFKVKSTCKFDPSKIYIKFKNVFEFDINFSVPNTNLYLFVVIWGKTYIKRKY